MLVGIVSVAALTTLSIPAGAPPPAPASTPAVTVSTQATICNKYCDARDPALSPGDRSPVSATLFGRTVRLHFDDADAMGWASIENGNPGDEVWLDRSFDGGRTWASGSRLGDTIVPAGQRGWRTQMYNVDDWNNHGVGALRACGKAGDRPDIACTPWARTTWNAGDRRTAAATALMKFYNYAHRPVRHHRLVELGQRAERDHRQHPGDRDGQLPLRDRPDVRPATSTRSKDSSATTTSTTPAGGGSPGSPRTT